MFIKKLSKEEKIQLKNELDLMIENVGGKKNFYELLEALRVRKPNPILHKGSKANYPKGVVRWNKVIRQENYELLKEAMSVMEDEHFLPSESHKKYKRIVSCGKALKPIVFQVQPVQKAGEGFSFSIIDLREEKAFLNPIFELMFFTSIEYIKKILDFQEEKK